MRAQQREDEKKPEKKEEKKEEEEEITTRVQRKSQACPRHFLRWSSGKGAYFEPLAAQVLSCSHSWKDTSQSKVAAHSSDASNGDSQNWATCGATLLCFHVLRVQKDPCKFLPSFYGISHSIFGTLISANPPLFLGLISTLSRSWGGSVLSWFWVGCRFLSFVGKLEQNLTKNRLKIDPLQGV